MQIQPLTEVYLIDQISFDLFVYQNPSILLDGPKKLINVSKANQQALKKYSQLLFNIRYAWQKTIKYKAYFSDFYPPEEKIEKVEALNHHIHAYLQDMDTFKNKIETFLNSLKKDLMAMASNKKEIKEMFEKLSSSITSAFGGVADARNPHTHHGMRFIDGDLLKAENAMGAIQAIQSEAFSPFINKEMVPKFLEDRLKEKEENFELAKERWLKNATKNNEQTAGLLNAILKAAEDPLYQFLDITPTKTLFSKIKPTHLGM